MAHSPSGSQAAAPSIGNEAFTEKLSALLFDVSQLVLQSIYAQDEQIAQCNGEIDAEVERARDAVAGKGRALQDERERVQKAALATLDILSGGRGAMGCRRTPPPTVCPCPPTSDYIRGQVY